MCAIAGRRYRALIEDADRGAGAADARISQQRVDKALRVREHRVAARHTADLPVGVVDFDAIGDFPRFLVEVVNGADFTTAERLVVCIDVKTDTRAQLLLRAEDEIIELAVIVIDVGAVGEDREQAAVAAGDLYAEVVGVAGDRDHLIAERVRVERLE